MKLGIDNKSTDKTWHVLKRIWFIRVIIVLLAVAIGGCLVTENNALTLIEKSIGSLLLALFVAETIAIVEYFAKKPSFILTAYLITQAFKIPYSKAK